MEAIHPGDIVRLTQGYFALQKQALFLKAGRRGRIERIGECVPAPPVYAVAPRYAPGCSWVAVALVHHAGLHLEPRSPAADARLIGGWWDWLCASFCMLFTEVPNLSRVSWTTDANKQMTPVLDGPGNGAIA